jgi:hypothetical protein
MLDLKIVKVGLDGTGGQIEKQHYFYVTNSYHCNIILSFKPRSLTTL